MRFPDGLIGKGSVLRKAAQLSLGQLLVLHIRPGRGVYHIVGMPGSQQLQEVDPTLALGAGKPGKPLIADMRAVAVLPLVARGGIIRVDI